MRISSPPVKWPCFYGIDFASLAELIANGLSVDEICASIGADSLGYISLEELTAATTIDGDKLCRACFDGKYPIDLPGAGAARQAHARGHLPRRGRGRGRRRAARAPRASAPRTP